MILTCPQCATRYQADEAKFPPAGRAVRCAKCGHNWHQPGPVPDPATPLASAEQISSEPRPLEDFLPKDDAPDAAPAANPAHAAVAAARLRSVDAGAPRAPSRALWGPRAALAAGWLALGAIVLLIAFSAVRYRQDIATAWPQSASLYETLGLGVNEHGIDLAHVAYSREIEDGQSVLAITGSIVNNAARELPVPQIIRVTLSDASDHELYHWTFPATAQTLKPGGSARFRTRLSSPPSGARHLELRFDGS